MRKLINLLTRKINSLLGTSLIKNIHEELTQLRLLQEGLYIRTYLKDNLFENNFYTQSKRITHFHKSVFSQNGEDGIIEEIFRRIGTTNKYFVEFGVHGVKNNSTFLLLKEWRGLWIGGYSTNKLIENRFKREIDQGNLRYCTNWITEENVEIIFESQKVPLEFDFLSIDLDGNDYWIWKAIQKFSPRVVCIEYNAAIPADITWVMTYHAKHVWDQTGYFGASLKALENLGKAKDYVLIGCDYSGCNAFFLRKDLDLNKFQSPFHSENHYEPPRYFLGKPVGHEPGFGSFLNRL